jgi:hypothetical protein
MKFSDLAHQFDLSFLEDAVILVDTNLTRLDSEAKRVEDPDQLGTFEKAEYIMGFGLVACQTYITACVSRTALSKGAALNLGPKHSCGLSIVCLVNALANYWKHHSEWESPLTGQAQKTVDAIKKLNVEPSGSYVVANSLHALHRPHEPRMRIIVPFLKQWRSDLSNAA